MKFEPRSNRDFLAGLLFVLIGGLAIVVARTYPTYPMGTAMRMGPGYFPTLLGAILLLFGVCILLRGIRSGAKPQGDWGWRPLALVTLSMLLFGFLVNRLGLVPALAAMFFAGAAAGREFRIREVLVLTATMTAFAVALFVYGLKLPLRLFLDTW